MPQRSLVKEPEATQMVLTSMPHRNQQLFSDHYLDVTLPERSDWKALATEAQPMFLDLQKLFACYTPSDKEAQLEEDFVKPVLRLLGHTFEVQPSLETPDGTKTPDYVFYRDQASLVGNKKQKLTDTLLEGRAFAVGDAKYWDRPLDVSLKRAGGDPFTNKNPSYQISFYMQHSGLAWGILTNGRLWRLYHKDTAHKLDRFYEVNLPELLQGDNVLDFLYFYAFFRRQAFVESGDLSIEAIRLASVNYARGVGDSLKAQVYEALRHVAQGFLDYPRNNLQPDQATLKAIYDNSLILLYRLLFILYTETRDLLPVYENPGYGKHYSLDSIKRSIQTNLKFRITLLHNTASLWGQLQSLFVIIQEGSPTLDVSTFNGSLFNPERHPFLEQYKVSDYHLQLAIDKLARVDGQFIDYRDLSERHIGTIYEGLLEFHLEQLTIPVDGWTIELRNEKGERHATGSYYTPDYIVKYMISETLEPVLRQAIQGATTEEEKIQAILSIRVLDPAMGSGHFPVEATEYIARFLIEHVERTQTDTGGETELAYWRRRVVQSCIYGVDLNPLAVDLAQLSLWLATVAKGHPLSFLDHHLRWGNSLVGARLAELSADTAGAKKNGKKARSPRLNGDFAQLMLFDAESLRQELTDAVDLMRQITMSPAQTASEVKKQEHVYRELRQRLTEKYSSLANVVSATHFGLTIDQTFWKSLADYATKRIPIGTPQFDAWLKAAQSAFETYHFFHWELEFPEVFFDEHGQHKGEAAGFHAVIGNPPYVRQEELGPFKTHFATTYAETYDGTADLYVYFYQQGLQLTRACGQMSYIVTNKWMRSGYGQRLRAYFAEEEVLRQIIDFGHAPIFEDADVFPCILILEKPQQQIELETSAVRQVQVLNFPREDLEAVVQKQRSLASYVQQHSHTLSQSRFGSAAWNLETADVDNLLAKLRRVGVPLSEFATVKPYRGVLTGLNEAFLIDTTTRNRLINEDPRSEEIIKPYLRGQDIKRWTPEWAELWMIFTRRGIDIDAYPAIKKHLLPFREQLEPKLKGSGDGPGRKPGSYRWYEIQDAVEYWPLFGQPKIMYQEIQFHPAYCFDNNKLFSNNKAFFLAKADFYLLAVLNSPLMWWHNWRYLPHMKDEALSPVGELMEMLPIAPPSEETREHAERASLRLTELTRTTYKARQDFLYWLQVEYDVQEPGRRLENFVALEWQEFIEEVRKRRPSSAKKLTPAALRELQETHTDQMGPIRRDKAEALQLEHLLSDLVNAAYGLTPEEVALLTTAAPPRMPFSLT